MGRSPYQLVALRPDSVRPHGGAAPHPDAAARSSQRSPTRRKASNVVNDWLRWRLRIDPRCLDTIGEAGSWPWDKRAAEHGVDRPVKTAEHAADCLRYLCHSIHTAEATAAIQPRILDPYSQDLPARVTDIMASERLSF